jgi:hypothetical protein
LKKIIVTPAGRKEFLEILYNNLVKHKKYFDKWVLWANTDNDDDLAYIRYLSEMNDFIEHIELDVPFDGNSSIASFFKYCTDSDAMYLRLDDDICYIHDNSVKNIFEYREANQEPFLIYGNIVNNAIVNYVHQRTGRYPRSLGINSYNALEYVEHDTSGIAVGIHQLFIDKYKNNKVSELLFDHKWTLLQHERASINAVAWLGKDFAEFNGIPDFSGQPHPFEIDEEEFLSCTMPRRLNRPNEIYGQALFVHFSFRPQLETLLNESPELISWYTEHSKMPQSI